MGDVSNRENWWSYGSINNGTSTEALMICQADNSILAQRSGIHVLDTPLSLILLEQPLLFVTSHGLHFFLRHLGQSLLVSQIAAGILLGPSFLSNPTTVKKLIPPVALYTLQTISRFGFLLYLFIVGVKTDISILKRTGSMAITLAFIGFLLSTFLGLTTFHFVKENIEESSRKTAPRLIILNSITFFIVTSHHLDSLEISNTELGRLASSVALALDISAMVMDMLVLKLFLQFQNFQEGSVIASSPLETLACTFAFYIVLFFGCRPLMIFIIKKTPIGTRMKESHLMLVLVIFFATVFVSQCINQPVSPYLLGLSLPNAPFGAILADKLEGILTGLFVPIFCSITGLRANFRLLSSKSVWLEMVFLMCYVGKIIGTIATSMLFKLSFEDALALALIVGSKGVMEIATLVLWRDEGFVSGEQYAMMLLHVLIVTKLAVPLARRLYDPARGYRAMYDRRTIQESFETNNIRILVCVYEDDDTTTALNLLESSMPSKGSTLNIIALHLVKLAGRSMPFREPLHLVHRSVVRQFLSEHTLNSFSVMERRTNGHSRVQHYMATSPYKTMYNDVCTLAHEWRINFIIVPFHKKWDFNKKNKEATWSSTPIREVNRRVLEEAPCVVGILVDGAKAGNKFYYDVAMIFIGGPDDQECLAYCRLLANHPKVRLSVVWLREKYDANKTQFGLENEDKDDVKLMKDFRYSLKDNQRVGFVEEYVSDGIETTNVVMHFGEVDLVVTGRWHDPYSPVLSGFNDWSECAELGTLGDMMAAPEFRCSVLVIQRQPMIAWVAS